MAALPLHIGRGHEGGAAQKKTGRLVLPIIGAVEQRAAEHAVAQDGAGRDQRDGGKDDDDVIAESEHAFECRHQRVARSGVRTAGLIRKRTMHHAATSDASFRRLAAVAALSPYSSHPVSWALSRHFPTFTFSS